MKGREEVERKLRIRAIANTYAEEDVERAITELYGDAEVFAVDRAGLRFIFRKAWLDGWADCEKAHGVPRKPT